MTDGDYSITRRSPEAAEFRPSLGLGAGMSPTWPGGELPRFPGVAELRSGPGSSDREFPGRDVAWGLPPQGDGQQLAVPRSGQVPELSWSDGAEVADSALGGEASVLGERTKDHVQRAENLRTCARAAAVCPLKLPWESNQWLGAVLGVKQDFMPLPTPRPFPLPLSLINQNEQAGTIVGIGVVGQRRKRRIQPWQAEVDEPRQVALEAWLHILEGYPGASKVGAQVSKKQDKEAKIQLLRDSLEHKATGTLRIRALDFKRFLGWMEDCFRNASDIVEEDCYDYCVELRIRFAAPTSASRFKQTITFAKHVLGWKVEEDAVTSTRVMGVGLSMMKTLTGVKRAAPFPPCMVLYLEDLILDVGQAEETRYYAGVLLFQIYSRSRFADMQNITKEPVLENGNLVSEVSDFKTKRAKERRGASLPVVAIGAGLHQQSWSHQFLAVRKTLKVEAGTAGLFFPALSEGRPGESGLVTADATKIVRRFVAQAIVNRILPKSTVVDSYSSHSCKRTLLHWAAADGMSLDDRRLLGNHVLKTDGSWLAYSHDGLAGPVANMKRAIRKVASGELTVEGSSLQPDTGTQNEGRVPEAMAAHSSA
eukprot:1016921-Amphidinium_carterae.1